MTPAFGILPAARSALPRIAAVAAILSAAGPLLGPRTAAAQPTDAPEAGSRAEVSGFIGVLAPVANLTDDPESFATVIDPYLAVGVDGILWVSDRFGVGVVGVYSPTQLAARATQFQGAIPDDLGDVTYLAGALNAVYRFPGAGSSGAFEPYFAGGLGLKYIGVDEIASPEVESTTDPTATVAAGARFAVLHRLSLRFEVRDFASFFESPTTGDSRLQNDVSITLGVGTSLP